MAPCPAYCSVLLPASSKEAIDKLNKRLEPIAKKHNAIWLDIGPALADDDVVLKKEYSYDGLHLNAEGYAIVTQYVMPHPL
jgi:lysophospholipase L1-like esterase